MKTKLSLLVIALFSMSFFSCKNDYKRTENGALMKFYKVNKTNETPQVGDLVIVDVTQKVADSILFSSFWVFRNISLNLFHSFSKLTNRELTTASSLK